MKFKAPGSTLTHAVSPTAKKQEHQEDFAAESLKESLAQLRVGFGWTLILVMLTVVALRIAGETQHFGVWIAGHGVVLVGSIIGFIAYRNDMFTSAGAHAVRRVSALTGGIAWGAAGILWPISAGRPSWIVLASCFAVLASGAAVTMATDPISFVLLIAGTLAPALLGGSLDVFPAIVVAAYSIFCFGSLIRNHSVFRSMVMLRSENSELLARALVSASAAERARDQALAAAKDKTRFLAAASHDLRQPMQALTLLSQTLTRTPLPPLDDIRNTASSIEHAALELTSLFNGILDLSELELGRTTNEPTPIDLRAMLEDVASGMLLDAEARNITVNVAGPRLTVCADPVLLWRVVSNLANNAMVHSGSDRILLSARSRGEYCLLQVWDQGKGIDEEDQALIFEEFAQLGNPERRRERGTGLGLSIVRRVCASNGWKTGVESRVGRGSTFYIRLPRLPATAHQATREPGGDVRGLNILVVEDDELVSESLALALRSSGARVTVAASADSALDLVDADSTFDVVLSDCRLPNGKTGIELAETLAHRRPSLPSVLLTGDLHLTPSAMGATAPIVIRKPAPHRAICDALYDAYTGRAS